MYLLFVLLPLLSFFILSIFSSFFGKKGSCYISTFFVFTSACISIFIFFEVVLNNSTCYFYLFPWVEVGVLSIKWSCFFDQLTAIMCIMITVVSFCVHLFSINYMTEDFQQERFMGLLSLFTFFMIILVVSDNLLQLLLGWEGVGLCSYLLINFWYMRKNTNDSSLKAVFFNRFGDLCLLFAIFLLFYYLKSINFFIIFDNYQLLLNQNIDFIFFSLNVLELICFCLTIAAMAKSAQIFLQGWLGDAMEGPTPVSALIHAATMVTAGIYLLMRFSALFVNAKSVLFIILISGALTTFFCSLIGVDSCDLKKIIASSTASQLGYMFYTCGLTEYSAALCHLFFHAFFKALLFLSAGAIIHSLSDEQDIRKMGGLLQKLPIVFVSMFIGSFALIGMPFIGGFYSKDPLLEYSDLLLYTEELMSLFAATLGAFNTSFYSSRLLSLVFLGDFKGQKVVLKYYHEPSLYLLIPLLILIFFTFFSYFVFDIFIGEGYNMFLFSGENIFLFKEGEEDLDVFILVFFFIFFGVFMYLNESFFDFFVILKNKFFDIEGFDFFDLLRNYNVSKWFFDLFFVKYGVSFFVNFSENLFLIFDRGIFDLYGSMFLFDFFSKLSFVSILEQSGFLYHYILYQIIWIILGYFQYVVIFNTNIIWSTILIVLIT
jgi:NADH-quinone oxidoreductase subunit L